MIESVRARQILDSRGNPTVECEIRCSAGLVRASVPSGASTGKFEAVELRDNEKPFRGKGVLKAVSNVNKIIAPKLVGKDPRKQEQIDRIMLRLDGTPNKSKLGANAILAVSLAAARAACREAKLPLYKYIAELFGTKRIYLPVPQMNVINGGKHAGIKNDIQEHMIVPLKFQSFAEALQAGCEVYYALRDVLKVRFGSAGVLVADEGGFAPPIARIAERLELLEKAIDECGYTDKIKLALDCAASQFYYDGTYVLSEREYSGTELIDFYSELIKDFPIFSIEDPFAEEDWQSWKEFSAKFSKKLQIVGDDLLVTNPERIQQAIREKACNALLLKLNQIGTVSEAMEAARVAFRSKWQVIVSHRSGETSDPFIASFVIGIGAMQCKFGAPARGERTAKYNQLLRIEEYLARDSRAVFAGKYLE